MSRDNERDFYFEFTIPAAVAGAVTKYTMLERPVVLKSFDWAYDSTETNADNTIIGKIDYTLDGTNFTTVFDGTTTTTGLLDTSAPLVVNVNKWNSVVAAGPGVDGGKFTNPASLLKIPAGAMVRIVVTTAGTGTIKLMYFALRGTTI